MLGVTTHDVIPSTDRLLSFWILLLQFCTCSQTVFCDRQFFSVANYFTLLHRENGSFEVLCWQSLLIIQDAGVHIPLLLSSPLKASTAPLLPDRLLLWHHCQPNMRFHHCGFQVLLPSVPWNTVIVHRAPIACRFHMMWRTALFLLPYT